jgi:hypothetical protein
MSANGFFKRFPAERRRACVPVTGVRPGPEGSAGAGVMGEHSRGGSKESFTERAARPVAPGGLEGSSDGDRDCSEH